MSSDYLEHIVNIDYDGNTVIKEKLLCDGKKTGIATSIFSTINEQVIQKKLPTCLKSNEVIVSEPIYDCLTNRQPFYASKNNFTSLRYDKSHIVAGELEVTLLKSEHTLGSSNILIHDTKNKATILYTSQFRKQEWEPGKSIDVLVLDSRNGIESSDAKLPIIRSKELMTKIKDRIQGQSLVIQADNFHIEEIMYEINQKFNEIQFASTHQLFEQVEIFRNNGYKIPNIIDNENPDEWNQLIESNDNYIVFAQRYESDPDVLMKNMQLYYQLEEKLENKFHCIQIFENEHDYKQFLGKRERGDALHFEENSNEVIICPNHIKFKETIEFIDKCNPTVIIVDNSSITEYGEPFVDAIKKEFPNKKIIAKPMRHN